ncbi:solute carrier family 43 member 3-like isoform X2 [Haliotis rubra]|uniref:solute carrier family 43 member 3-like isoform X2 n=1 Tax=Haliotis rubra TaxID=36100 RepID=UPI001EE50F8A|nr:solute carrier family 43 member 3-like isoform X2 [Haliotis rubra]
MADTSLPFVLRFRFVAALWCVVESLLFGGLFFGWASLVYVFKQEGIYSFLCNHPAANGSTGSNVSNSLGHESIRDRELEHTLLEGNTSQSYPSYSIHDTEHGVNANGAGKLPPASCKEQDAILNLWFTVAVSVLSIATSVIGWILYRFGPLVLRVVGSVTFCTGTLMLAFVDNNAPWIICPGLLSMAFGAVCINAANLQVIPFLFNRGSSVAVSLLTGFYYSASTTQWLIKVAFENGIPRQHSYILLSSLNAVFVTANSILFFRRSQYPVRELTVPVEENDVSVKDNQQFPPLVTCEKSPAIMDGKEQLELNIANGSPPCSPKHDVDSPMLPSPVGEEVMPTLRSCVFNRTFLFHLFWFVVNDFYLLTFIGISNAMLERVLHRHTEKVNHFTDVFSFSLMCAAIFAVVGGFLYDCQRMAFKDYKGYHRQLLPAVFPLTMTTLLGAVTVGLQFIQAEEILYALFVLFVIYKQCVFALTWSFVVDVYPREYFGVFYGIVFTTAGIVLFLQYALFMWIASGPFAPIAVNLFLLCLLLLSLVNPLNLLIKGTCGQSPVT